MTEEELNLVREIHSMIKEILEFVREQKDENNIEKDDLKDFLMNVAANLAANRMEQLAKENENNKQHV